MKYSTRCIMADREDLEKLFDAALHERKAPSRFGTPEEQVLEAPVAFQPAAPVSQKAEETAVSPFRADTSEAKPFLAAEAASPFQAAPPEGPPKGMVVLDEMAAKSLDEGLNAELEELLDKKISKEKAKRRRDRMVMMVLLFGAAGGGAFWLYQNPDKMESLKKAASEIKMFTDPNAVADQYKDSLDKVGKHGDKIGEATNMLGGEVAEGEDQGLDKEMTEFAGEEAGLSASEKQKKLKAQFESVKNKKAAKPGEESK